MSVPSAFDGFDQIEGFDPVDKEQLVGKPFGITGVRFRTNERNERDIVFAEVETINTNGEQAAFQDASTGVRDQLIKYLAEHTVTDYLNEGQWHDLKLFVPRGLRVSQYDWPDPATGKTKPVRTYYLTTAGRTRQP